MSVPAYAEYKESGVPWLGEVPSHWEVVQSKRCFRRRKDLNKGMICEDRLALTMNGVVPRSLDDLDGLQSSDYEGYQIFEAGNLAFKLIDLQNIKTSRVGTVPTRGIMSPAYVRLEPASLTVGSFGFWYFMALYWLQVFNNLGGGVRQTLGPEELLTLPFPLPSEVEQRAIATFLDCETAKIDALVAEQERLIVLLKEKRQAVISHAVTKGLNPNASMKDSGIEWLGEIPAHWEIRRLKQVAVGQLSYGANEAADEAIEDHPRFVRITDVAANGTLRPDTFRSLPPAVAEPYLLEEGDILLARSGGTVGKSFIYRVSWGDCCYAGYLIRLRVAVSTYLPDLVYMTLQSNAYWQQLGANQIQSTIQNFSAEKYGDMIFAFPPLEEQRAIASELSHRLSRFDELSHEAEEAITLLQERRAALISAAVTGKIDVRGLVETSQEVERA